MLTIRSATPADVPLVVSLIEDLAEYEKLRNECVATEEALHEHLFGERRFAEVLVSAADVAGIDLFDAALRKLDENAAKYPVERARGRGYKYDAI